MPVESVIASHYGNLSESQRKAADFLVANKLTTATRSLRAVASESGVSAATFSRLARTIGFTDYEALRRQVIDDVGAQTNAFSEKARRLQQDAADPGGPSLLLRQADACLQNIAGLQQDIDPAALEATADCLASARNVLIVGGLGSAGIAEYCAYIASWVAGNWRVAGRNGVTLGAALSGLDARDAMIVIAKAPYALRSVRAAKIASERGATVIALTDSHAFPGLSHARHGFILRTESPQFFSSYAATLVLLESIVAMTVPRIGAEAEARIQRIAAQNRLLEEIENS